MSDLRIPAESAPRGKHVWTVGKRLTAGFATMVILLTAIGATSAFVMHQASIATKAIAQGFLPEMKVTTAFEREILNARIHFIYHVTIQKPGALELGWTRFRNARALVADLKGSVAREDLTDLVGLTQQLLADLDSYEVQLNKILDLVASGTRSGDEYTRTVSEWARLGGKLVGAAAELNRRSSELALAEAKVHSRELDSTVPLIIAGCIIAVIVAVVLGYLLVHAIGRMLRSGSRRLNDAADRMLCAFEEITRLSRSLAEGASEQASAVQQTSASCEEITATARKNAENSASMAEVLEQSATVSESGMEGLEQLRASVAEVAQASQSVSAILRTIDDIAFQTNILALNAAVEAARAGEAGAGFSVVAHEVRNLAQRSAQAARETAELIETSTQKADRSRTQVDAVAEVMRAVANHAGSSRGLACEVSAGSAQQTIDISQIAQAMEQIHKVTQHVSGSAGETATAAAEISCHAVEMKSIAKELSAFVG